MKGCVGVSGRSSYFVEVYYYYYYVLHSHFFLLLHMALEFGKLFFSSSSPFSLSLSQTFLVVLQVSTPFFSSTTFSGHERDVSVGRVEKEKKRSDSYGKGRRSNSNFKWD